MRASGFFVANRRQSVAPTQPPDDVFHHLILPLATSHNISLSGHEVSSWSTLPETTISLKNRGVRPRDNDTQVILRGELQQMVKSKKTLVTLSLLLGAMALTACGGKDDNGGNA